MHSVSKLLVPGLRVGFLVAPEGMVERLAANVWATTWMAAPPLAEIVARWIDDGTIRRFTAWRRDEARARNVLAGRILVEARTWSDPRGYHLWLELPEPWSSRDFVDQARRRGVAVCGPEVFVAGRGRIPHAVRVALQAPRERRRLEEGLRILAELLRAPRALRRDRLKGPETPSSSQHFLVLVGVRGSNPADRLSWGLIGSPGRCRVDASCSQAGNPES
ncbi:MAG: hypothetical protein GY856_05050 [bacterium]|nr:hypothetical protein [bacterium]